jgi:antitoxin (DNA-binding transcriptional repressor) of toxin-antitoxin stability system
MKTVGIRELKNRLSEYLRDVQRGESVLVTDRGEVVAELSQPGRSPSEELLPAGLVSLARRGILTLGTLGDGKVYAALPRSRRAKHSAAQLLDEERGLR